MNEHRRGPALLAAMMAAAMFHGGCSRLLDVGDYAGYTVPSERLRQVDALELEAGSKITTTAPTSAPATQPAPREVKLSLAQCRAAALEGNLGLKVALLSPAIAAEGITEAEAQFEAMFLADVSVAATDTPVASTLTGMATKNVYAVAALRMPLPTGTSLEARLPYSRYETDNVFSTLNPSFTTDLSLSVTQQLLRGAWLRTNTHAIRIARWNTMKSEAMTKLEVIRVLAAVDRLYWRLYAAREQLRVRRQEHELAEAQLARVRRQVKAGDKAEVEILRAELGVAERVEAIIIAGNIVRLRQRELKRMLQKPGLEMGAVTEIIPATPADIVPYNLAPDALIETALASRMELLELELRIAQDASTIDFARNQTLPLVALAYTYNINGLGPTASDAFDLMFERRFEDHRLGVHVEVPLGNQGARSRLRRAILARIGTLADRDRRKSLIAKEVRDSIDRIQANWQRVVAGRRRVELAGRVLQAEHRQFDLGLLTSTEVLQAQASLANARSAEVNAVAEYQVAQVDLAVATGTLLGAARIRWAPTKPAEAWKK